MDRYHGFDGQAVKDVYVYPLCRNVQERLRTTEPPGFRGCAEQAP
jgi:hypothetical protein